MYVNTLQQCSPTSKRPFVSTQRRREDKNTDHVGGGGGETHGYIGLFRHGYSIGVYEEFHPHNTGIDFIPIRII